MERWELLNKWVTQCIIENPNLIRDAKSATCVYAELYEIWALDCQKSMKFILLKAQETEG